MSAVVSSIRPAAASARSAAQVPGAGPFEILLVDNDAGAPPPALALPGNARLLACAAPGSYAARNAGAAEARGAWLVFTDADCRVPPDWLRTLTDAYRKLRVAQPALVAVGGGNVPPAGERSDFLDALGLTVAPVVSARPFRRRLRRGGGRHTAPARARTDTEAKRSTVTSCAYLNAAPASNPSGSTHH